MRILVVDDEPAVADVIADSVRSQGHEAIVARGGDEALRLLESCAPNGVFLDLVMPDLHGMDLLRQIRHLYPGLPVIVLSGRASPEMIDEATRLGVVDVVEKPMVLAEWGQALRRIAHPL